MPKKSSKSRTKPKARAKKPAAKRAATPWVASVPVVVSDRRAAKVWYADRLGLKVTASEDHWLTVGGGGKAGNLHLCQASENQPTPIPLEPGPSGIVIAIPGDFVKECARLEAAGIAFAVRPTHAPWGWYATVRDPDGNEHHLSPAE
jgi:catechol 2,3-dioxygenase-like lactoylglutathione lyase family enzyme